MLRVRVSAAGVLGFCVLAVGCGSAPADGGESILVAEQGIIVINGVDPAFFWETSTQKALGALVQARLADALGGRAGDVLLSSGEGRELVEHVVACALPEGSSLETASGWTFDGAVGLAPEWLTAPLSEPEARRWTTACLLQSLNGVGAHVAVRMVGGHPALADAPGSEAEGYTVREAIMFGDLFDPAGPTAFACADDALADERGVQLSARTPERICGRSPRCGLTLLGRCEAVCALDGAGAPVCRAPGGGDYPESIASRLEPLVSVPSGGLTCGVLDLLLGAL